jgi:hypothetical protein
MCNEDKSNKNDNMQGLGEAKQPNLDATMMDSNLIDLHEYNTNATGPKEELVKILDLCTEPSKTAPKSCAMKPEPKILKTKPQPWTSTTFQASLRIQGLVSKESAASEYATRQVHTYSSAVDPKICSKCSRGQKKRRTSEA